MAHSAIGSRAAACRGCRSGRIQQIGRPRQRRNAEGKPKAFTVNSSSDPRAGCRRHCSSRRVPGPPRIAQPFDALPASSTLTPHAGTSWRGPAGFRQMIQHVPHLWLRHRCTAALLRTRRPPHSEAPLPPSEHKQPGTSPRAPIPQIRQQCRDHRQVFAGPSHTPEHQWAVLLHADGADDVAEPTTKPSISRQNSARDHRAWSSSRARGHRLFSARLTAGLADGPRRRRLFQSLMVLPRRDAPRPEPRPSCAGPVADRFSSAV